jgi:hypothetical protein
MMIVAPVSTTGLSSEPSRLAGGSGRWFLVYYSGLS